MAVAERSATTRAYDAILDGILNGRHVSGEMLGETTLAAELGLSRTPIRMALALLQDEGWITVYPKRGALVRGLSERDVAHLADARLILEATSIRRADAQARKILAARLHEEIARQRQLLARSDLRAFIESTMVFHRAFVEAGENTVILELNDRLADRQRFLLYSFGDALLARCADIISEHEQLVSALEQGDAAAFSRVLRRHLGETYGTSLPELCSDSPPLVS